MADPFSLRPIQRTTLSDLRRVQSVRDDSAARLGTGLRVREVRDDPIDFFQAQALSRRVSDLLDTKSGIGRGLDTLEASHVGLDAAQALTRQLAGLVEAARADESGRADYAARFDVLRGQLDALVADASFQGTNLVSAQPGSLDVRVGDGAYGHTLGIDGTASDASGLGIGTATTDYNGFATAADLDAALGAVETARATIRGTAARIGSNAAVLQIRDDFSENLAATLEAGAAKLTSADLTAEGARSVAAEVRQGLSLEGLRLAARSDRLIVGLVETQ